MVRYVRENDVERILAMPTAIELAERAFRDRAAGEAFDTPRQRTRQPGGHLHVLQGAAPRLNVIGFKAYYTRPTARTFLVTLINLETGRLEALIEAERLGLMRTGGATGVATRLLAREDASVVACFGSGRHAVTQLEAVCAVRPIRGARVFGRDRDRLERFCEVASQSLGIDVRPAASRAEALSGAHIINVVTRSDTPVFEGARLEPGQHINAVGSNALSRREIDLETVRRSDVIVVDSVDVARGECGDLLPAIELGLIHWEHIADLGDVLLGRRAGRTSSRQITLFESHGMGLLDLYASKYVLDVAGREGLGVDLPIGDSR